MVHVREGPFHQQPTINHFNYVFLFPFLVIKPKHDGICSRQPYHLDRQQKKRGHQQSFHKAGTQYGAVVNYRRRCVPDLF